MANIVPIVLVTKLRAMAESALRTFVQAALPAAMLAWQATDHDLSKAALLAAAGAGTAAGLASVGRLVFPLATDKVGVGVK